MEKFVELKEVLHTVSDWFVYYGVETKENYILFSFEEIKILRGMLADLKTIDLFKEEEHEIQGSCILSESKKLL